MRKRGTNLRIIATIVALFFGAAVVSATSTIANVLSGINGNAFRVPVGATATVDTDYIVGSSASGCKVVTNNGSQDIFIPTNSATEWDNFVNNHPGSVTIGACGPTCSYNWSGNLTTCGNGGNAFPWQNEVTGTCDINHVGWYKIISNVGSSCLAPGVGVTYTYQQCGESCSSTGACTITIGTGGIGGVQSSFNIGRVEVVANAATSVGNCSASGTTRSYGPTGYVENGFWGPITATPGTSPNLAPSEQISGGSWNPSYSSFTVETTVSSVTCPAGTTVHPSLPATFSSVFGSYGTSMPGLSNNLNQLVCR